MQSSGGTENQKYPPGRQKNLNISQAQALIPSTRETEISGSLEFPDSQDSIIKRPCLSGKKKKGKKEIRGKKIWKLLRGSMTIWRVTEMSASERQVCEHFTNKWEALV